MNHTPSTTTNPNHPACPAKPILVELPLATIEELDNLAQLAHTNRQTVAVELITAALIDENLLTAATHDRRAEHARLTVQRSHELAATETVQ